MLDPAANRCHTPLARLISVLPPFLRRQKLLTALYRSHVISARQLITFNGNARAWVDLRDAESRATLLSGTFWPEFPPMVAAFLRSGGDLFDVGANLGLVTFGVLPLLRFQPRPKYHLFEANPRLIPLLRLSAEEWRTESFSINHCCVTDRPGLSYHSLPDSQWGHGQISTSGDEVPNLLLDDYLIQQRVAAVGFLKLDVEGWELFALRGAHRALSCGKIRAGLIEVAPVTLARAGCTVNELLDFLKQVEFDIYFAGMWDYEDPHRLDWRPVDVNGTPLRFARALPLPPTFRQGDVLALHSATPLAHRVRSAFEA